MELGPDRIISYAQDSFRELSDHSKIAIAIGTFFILIHYKQSALVGTGILFLVYLANRFDVSMNTVDDLPLINREEHSDLDDEKLDLLEELAEEYHVRIEIIGNPLKRLPAAFTLENKWIGVANPGKGVVRLEKQYLETADLYNIEHVALHEIGHCVMRHDNVLARIKDSFSLSGGDGDAEKWAAKHFSGTKEEYYELLGEIYYLQKVGEDMKPFLKEERSSWF